MRRFIGSLVVLILSGQGICRALTPQEIKAIRPEDLGQESVDVSGYPPVQQENYKLFLSRCSICHSPARPLNSKIVSRQDWEHFVPLMRSRLIARGMKPIWTPEEGVRIIDFLAYDSYVRKVEQKVAFEQDFMNLEKRFKDLQKMKAERAKNQVTKPAAPYTGDNR